MRAAFVLSVVLLAAAAVLPSTDAACASCTALYAGTICSPHPLLCCGCTMRHSPRRHCYGLHIDQLPVCLLRLFVRVRPSGW